MYYIQSHFLVLAALLPIARQIFDDKGLDFQVQDIQKKQDEAW